MELIAWVLIGALTSYLAKQKGRDPVTWFVIGTLFSLFGLIALYFMPSKEASANKDSKPENPVQIADDHELVHDWYYADQEHQQRGPISYHELMSLWNTYVISNDSLVWSEGMLEWMPFGQQFKKQ